MFIQILSLVIAAQGPALSCPIMGSAINGKPAETIEFNGARYGTCCGGCGSAFVADPAKALKAEKVKGKTLGTFLFDPVSGQRLEANKAAATADFNGLRYPFASAANKAAFEKDAKKYAATPKMESVYCPVMKSPIASISKANSYVDHEGTRYYMCCGGCDGKFKANPAAYIGNAKDKVQAPKAVMAKA